MEWGDFYYCPVFLDYVVTFSLPVLLVSVVSTPQTRCMEEDYISLERVFPPVVVRPGEFLHVDWVGVSRCSWW